MSDADELEAVYFDAFERGRVQARRELAAQRWSGCWPGARGCEEEVCVGDLARTLAEVEGERISQDARWGQQDHDDGRWALILAEEVGEAVEAAVRRGAPYHHTLDLLLRAGDLAREDLARDPAQAGRESSRDDLRRELLQVAAVAVAWVECLDRRARDATGEEDA